MQEPLPVKAIKPLPAPIIPPLLQEPPPVKAIKPLPAPIDVPGKKRGGRRVRKMKERMAVTDFRKAANRMTFGEMEEDLYQVTA